MQLIGRSEETMKHLASTYADENNMPADLLGHLHRYFVEQKAPLNGELYDNEGNELNFESLPINYWVLITTFKGKPHIRKLNLGEQRTSMHARRRIQERRTVMLSKYLNLYNEGACTGDFIIMKSKQDGTTKRSWPIKWDGAHHIITGVIEWIMHMGIKELESEQREEGYDTPEASTIPANITLREEYERWWQNSFLTNPTYANLTSSQTLERLKRRAQWIYVLERWPDRGIWKGWIEQFETRFGYAKYIDGKAEVYFHYPEGRPYIQHDVEEGLLI